MRRKKKTTIVTIEARERTLIQRGRRRVASWCDQCCADVLMVTPSEAAALLTADLRAIFRLVEAGQVHFIESDDGSVIICSKSLDTKRN